MPPLLMPVTYSREVSMQEVDLPRSSEGQTHKSMYKEAKECMWLLYGRRGHETRSKSHG